MLLAELDGIICVIFLIVLTGMVRNEQEQRGESE
jgi:hypothetical protein